MSTNQGDLDAHPGPAKAPCAAASFAYLAAQGFFDGSPCHREVNQPRLRRAAVRRPDRHRHRRPELHVRPRRSPSRDDLPARHHRDGQHRPAGLDRQPVLPRLRRHASSPRTTPSVGTIDEAGLAVLDKVAAARQRRLVRRPRPAAAPRSLPVDDQHDDRQSAAGSRCRPRTPDRQALGPAQSPRLGGDAVDVEDAVDVAHGLQHVAEVLGVGHLEGEPADLATRSRVVGDRRGQDVDVLRRRAPG